VAAMPSVSLIRKLTVLGVAIASLGVSASSASASDVWLWACHGPSGSPLGNAFGSNNLTPYDGGCASAGGSLDNGGLRGALTPANGLITGSANANFTIPSSTKLTGLRVQRRATGVAAGLAYSVTAPTSQNALETVNGADVPADDKTFTVDPGATVGGTVSVALGCGAAARCAAGGPATLDVSRIGLKVAETGDAQGPTFAVGGTRSPAAGTLNLDIRANDAGVGLNWAEAGLVGGPLTRTRFAASNCNEITPDDATIDLPLDNDCPHVDKAGIDIALNALNPNQTPVYPDGNYTLVVRVADWAGNVTEQTSPIEILNNVNLGQRSQTLNIGTSDNTLPTVNATTNTSGGTSGVAGQNSQNCTTPRLSFSLSQKPMRISKGVPVLQSGKRYRFNGRLTCVINKKRRSAPKGARVELTNKIGKKTYTKTGTTVRSDGKLTIILSYKTSRTVIFRFTNSDGKRSQVSIKVKVEKKKKTSKR
jgi:hypothetical protein